MSSTGDIQLGGGPCSTAIIAPETPEPDEFRDMLEADVREVFDGDGFAANVWDPLSHKWISRVPFRFAFIDAPEMQQPFANEAKEYLQTLIGGTRIRLALIGKQSSGYMPLDKYRRLLCMGYLTEDIQTGGVEYFQNGKCDAGTVRRARPVTRNIELEMLVNGWAWVMKQYAFDREADYFAAQEDARRNRRGLWSMENPEAPWKFKEKQKRRRIAAQRQPNLF